MTLLLPFAQQVPRKCRFLNSKVADHVTFIDAVECPLEKLAQEKVLLEGSDFKMSIVHIPCGFVLFTLRNSC